jgi:putative ABC transport system ATP-binding protein
MAEPLLLFEGVTLRSPSGRELLAGASWGLERGARVRVAATRGSGATLLLRLAAGLAHPQEGRVLLEGAEHRPFRFDHPFLLRGAVGWVPQEGDLVSNLTLLDNVMLQARFAGGAGRYGAERAARALLARLGFGEEGGARPDALSRPQRKLGALARAALAGAELWLVDRLLDGLDGAGRERALDLLGERLELPGATLLITGDDPELDRLTTGVVRLEGGRLRAEERR